MKKVEQKPQLLKKLFSAVGENRSAHKKPRTAKRTAPPAVHGAPQAVPVRRKKKKYRLKPEAKRFYMLLLILLAVLFLLIFGIKLIFFRTSFTLKNYDMTMGTFDLADPIYDVIHVKEESDLIITRFTATSDKTSNITSVEMNLAQLLSENRYREWTLSINKNKAQLHKGKKVNQSYNAFKEAFPPLRKAMDVLKLTPLSYFTSQITLQEGESFEITTREYKQPLNADYKPLVSDGVSLLWVQRTGLVTPVNTDFNAYGNYLMMDCSVLRADNKPELKYILLLEVRL